MFVLDTNKAIETIEEILREKVKDFNVLFNKEYEYDDMFDSPYIYTQSDYDASIKRGDGWCYHSQENIGKIILCGSSDNSIPYEMWEIINNLFNGSNYHLG